MAKQTQQRTGLLPGTLDSGRLPRNSPWHGPRVHHELRRQQVLSRHHARPRPPRHARPKRSRQAHRHQSHPAPWNRKVGVYVPSAYVPGSIAPFIVGADGIDRSLFTALDSLIVAHKLPVMIGISIANGGGDAQGSQRGLEYDTMSGRYAEFVEQEVLPLVEAQAHVKLTHDPDARAATGGSSGAALSDLRSRRELQ